MGDLVKSCVTLARGHGTSYNGMEKAARARVRPGAHRSRPLDHQL